MPPKKILIVDDDKDIHDLLAAALRRAGFQVSGALDPVQGLMMARQQHPDLVILDVMMPGGGGVAMYDRIRNLSTTSDIQVLVCSSLTTEEIAARFPSVDPSMAVSKTTGAEEIINAVKRSLGAE